VAADDPVATGGAVGRACQSADIEMSGRLMDLLETLQGETSTPGVRSSDATERRLRQAADRTEESIVQIGLRMPSVPVVGTLPIGQLEPITLRSGAVEGSHLVLFEPRFVDFAELLAEVVVKTSPRHPDGPQELADVLVSYAVTGNPNPGGPRSLSQAGRLPTQLVTTMLLFAVAHEYAHAVLAHLPQARRTAPLSAADAWTLRFSWHHQLDADVIGVRLAAEGAAQEGLSLATLLCGAELLLNAIELMDRAVSLLTAGDEDAWQLGFHPPAAIRRQSLHRLVPQIAGAGNAELVPAAVAAARAQEQRVADLWKRARPILVGRQVQGTVVHPSWRITDALTLDE
jgi:hypothetical protein